VNAVVLTIAIAAAIAAFSFVCLGVHYWMLAAQHRASGRSSYDVLFSPFKGDPERYTSVGRGYLTRAKLYFYGTIPLGLLASVLFRLIGSF
jgi:hypothetical protein